MQKQIKKRIENLAIKQSVENNFLCLVEEVGEISKDLFENKLEHAALECVDTIVAALGVFYSLGGTDEKLKERLERSVTKWENYYKQ